MDNNNTHFVFLNHLVVKKIKWGDERKALSPVLGTVTPVLKTIPSGKLPSYYACLWTFYNLYFVSFQCQ